MSTETETTIDEIETPAEPATETDAPEAETAPTLVLPSLPRKPESGAQRKNRLRVRSPMAEQTPVQRGRPRK